MTNRKLRTAAAARLEGLVKPLMLKRPDLFRAAELVRDERDWTVDQTWDEGNPVEESESIVLCPDCRPLVFCDETIANWWECLNCGLQFKRISNAA